MANSPSPTAEQREASLKAANSLFEKPAVKQDLETESAARDAKTARLRALRLEKEKEQAGRDAEASAKDLPPKGGKRGLHGHERNPSATVRKRSID